MKRMAVLLLWCAPVMGADSVTLSCQDVANPGITSTLRVNYATRLVEEIGPSGSAYTNRTASNASISDNAIVWRAELLDTGLQKPVPMVWEGNIDRLSGTARVSWSREPFWEPHWQTFHCTPANTPKF